jgi:hypothetical protein
VRPPSCARPTISSLRKMNRTFSLNNVSNVELSLPNEESILEQKVQQRMNNGPNMILPLTQATLAVATASYNNKIINNYHHHNNYNDNFDVQSTCSHLSGNKFQTKYASSAHLNDFNNNYQHNQQTLSRDPFYQQLPKTSARYSTLTTSARRHRTPRNAEEYLQAVGVTDTEYFLNKGFYVGSMLNLNELNNSSSSYSANNNSNVIRESKNSFINNNKTIDNFKQRGSVQEATSISMASLNFLNHFTNNNGTHQNDLNSNIITSPSTNINSRSKNYNRSNTAGILISQQKQNQNENDSDSSTRFSNHHHHHHHHQLIDNGLVTSHSSSATPSDSSTSPTPPYSNTKETTKSNSLRPLMSALDKAEHLNSPKQQQQSMNNDSKVAGFIQKHCNVILNSRSGGQSNNNLNNHKDSNDLTKIPMDDPDFDEYEFLERNFGAEPQHQIQNQNNHGTSLKKDNNSPLNTNINEYYTDESNSIHNEDNGYQIINNRQQQQQQQSISRRIIIPSNGNINNRNQTWDRSSLAALSSNSLNSGLFQYLYFIK